MDNKRKLEDYMKPTRQPGQRNLLDDYIRMSMPTLDTTSYTNMLNQLLSSDDMSGNNYQNPSAMEGAVSTAKRAQYIANKYNIGDNRYRSYIDSIVKNASGRRDFMSQFTGQQDYNERYAYPMTVQDKILAAQQ